MKGKINMRKYICLVFVSLLVVSAASFAIPDWSMSDQGATSQTWNFYDSEVTGYTAVADIISNPFAVGAVSADISGSDLSYDSVNDIWNGTDITFTATIPNSDDTREITRKYIRIDYRYMGFPALTWTEPFITDDQGEPISQGIVQFDRETPVDDGNGWFTQSLSVVLEPNPNWETICLGVNSGGIGSSGMAALDYVKIDTLCTVPAPGAFLLGGIGLSIVGYIKKRRMLN